MHYWEKLPLLIGIKFKSSILNVCHDLEETEIAMCCLCNYKLCNIP